jgi:hypothetical protein
LGHCNAGWHLNSFFGWTGPIKIAQGKKRRKSQFFIFYFVGFLLNIFRIYLRRKRFLVFLLFSRAFSFYFWKTKQKKSRGPVLNVGDEDSNTLGIPVEYTRATTKNFLTESKKTQKDNRNFRGN